MLVLSLVTSLSMTITLSANAPVAVKTDTATFGTGCFWCTEAVFQELKGVLKVTSGYSGGHVANPSYEEVCTGTTGHAECLQVIYDPTVITYDELLEVFWESHDPTTLNRQGPDVGTQYRSVIFTHGAEQERVAKERLEAAKASGRYTRPIVTVIEPAQTFWKAEDYHQNYFEKNHGHSCHVTYKELVNS